MAGVLTITYENRYVRQVSCLLAPCFQRTNYKQLRQGHCCQSRSEATPLLLKRRFMSPLSRRHTRTHNSKDAKFRQRNKTMYYENILLLINRYIIPITTMPTCSQHPGAAATTKPLTDVACKADHGNNTILVFTWTQILFCLRRLGNSTQRVMIFQACPMLPNQILNWGILSPGGR